jgi:Fic family protein
VDLEALKQSPLGTLVPILVPTPGSGESTSSYWAFVPKPLPEKPTLTLTSVSAATKAAMAVARLDQAVSQLPNPELLLRPIIRREAASTSALEGTYAEFDEVLEADFLEDRQMSREQREIPNVVRATEAAVAAITTRPISRKLIGELQAIIVQGTDGETYDSGDLRQRQVYIGPPNRPVEEARFVPCPPGDVLVEGFSDWEKWINGAIDVPIIIRLALGHYQFETLHPYADGNGRLGRLILTLQLIENAALRAPILNISTWLESRRTEYLDNLLKVTCTGDFDPWISFISEGVREQSDKGLRDINRLLAFKDALVTGLRARGLKGSSLVIAENLIGYPALDVAVAKQITGHSFQAANTAVARLVELGVLKEVTGRPTNRLFYCPAILDMLNDRERGEPERLLASLAVEQGR